MLPTYICVHVVQPEVQKRRREHGVIGRPPKERRGEERRGEGGHQSCDERKGEERGDISLVTISRPHVPSSTAQYRGSSTYRVIVQTVSAHAE